MSNINQKLMLKDMKNWTKNSIIAEAKKYQKRSDFKKNCGSAYYAARALGILDDVCKHMLVLRKRWTAETIHKEALKYNHRRHFQMGAPGAFDAAWRLGIIESVCEHMSDGRSNLRKWSVESVKKLALGYTHRSLFMRGHPGAYKAAKKLGIMDEVCSHMNTIRELWCAESAAKEALKYQKRAAFMRESAGAYAFCLRNGLIDQVCLHMEENQKQWSEDEIALEAKKYDRRVDFKFKSSNAYKAAQRRGIIDKVCSHMEWHYKPSNVVYIWKAENQYFNKKQVYKIGVTVDMWGKSRIDVVAKNHGFNATEITMSTCLAAREVEKKLLSFGDNPNFKGDGASEFRALTKKEHEKISSFIKSLDVKSEDLVL